MKTVTVTKPSKEMTKLLATARKEDLVLRTPEGEEFMLSAIDDFEHELARQRQNKKLMSFLDERYGKGRAEKGIPLKEAFRLLENSSKKTKKRTKTGKTTLSTQK